MSLDFTENYMERLRAVFDLCDTGKKGYISVDHFKELAREHFGADQDDCKESIGGIVALLDPEGDGKIYFEGFCEGVKQILEIKSPSATDSAPRFPVLAREDVLGSRDTLVPGNDDDRNSSGTHETSEVSTFNEYDVMTDDDTVMSSGMTSSNHSEVNVRSTLTDHLNRLSEDDRDSAFSGKSSDSRVEQLVPDEERYEYSAEDEFTTLSSHRHLNSSPSWMGKPVTSNALASQLYRSATMMAEHPDLYEDIDGSMIDLQEKVTQLEAQLHLVQERQKNTEERHSKLKEENASHVERIHVLEEQLRDVEMKSQERLLSEHRRHADQLSRTDKDKTNEIDILSHSLKHIEKDYFSLKEEAPRLRADNDKLRKENSAIENQLSRSQLQLRDLADEHEKLQARFTQECKEMADERKVSAQLVDELSKELDELRSQRSLTGASGLSPRLPRSQRRELEDHIKRLKEDNVKLQEQFDEVQAQLLSTSLAEGKSLLMEGDASLAEEISNLPRDELMTALKKEQDANRKLREYIDRMVLRIIEKSPSLLEIQRNGNKKK